MHDPIKPLNNQLKRRFNALTGPLLDDALDPRNQPTLPPSITAPRAATTTAHAPLLGTAARHTASRGRRIRRCARSLAGGTRVLELIVDLSLHFRV